MKLVEMEVYSEATNCPVLRFPGRRFPGVLIQGDTLRNLLVSIELMAALDSTTEEYSDEMTYLRDQLRSIINHYEQRIQEHGLELPYPTRREGN